MAATAVSQSIRAFEVVLAFPQGIGDQDLSVNLCKENDRQPSTNENESSIETIWADRIASNSSLFNGTKFRFESVLSSFDTAQHQRTVVNLGITDYKSFLGTNCASPCWQQLAPAHLASPLGNAAIVETKDGQIILLKRSGNVGEMPHTIVMPGGHPEPEMVGIRTMEDWRDTCRTSRPDDQYNSDRNSRICHELWDSMIREVVEETGIPKNALGRMLCIGFSRRVENYRPDIIFHVPCDLAADAVHQIYTAGPEHKSESTALLTMDRLDFIRKVIEDDALNMPGCHRGGVELYRRYLVYKGIL